MMDRIPFARAFGGRSDAVRLRTLVTRVAVTSCMGRRAVR
jgi:hypothetical protein